VVNYNRFIHVSSFCQSVSQSVFKKYTGFPIACLFFVTVRNFYFLLNWNRGIMLYNIYRNIRGLSSQNLPLYANMSQSHPLWLVCCWGKIRIIHWIGNTLGPICSLDMVLKIKFAGFLTIRLCSTIQNL